MGVFKACSPRVYNMHFKSTSFPSVVAGLLFFLRFARMSSIFQWHLSCLYLLVSSSLSVVRSTYARTLISSCSRWWMSPGWEGGRGKHEGVRKKDVVCKRDSRGTCHKPLSPFFSLATATLGLCTSQEEVGVMRVQRSGRPPVQEEERGRDESTGKSRKSANWHIR